MIDVDGRDMSALEEENRELRTWLTERLETPIDTQVVDRKQLERLVHQLTALEIFSRQLYEQNQILEHAAGNDIMHNDMSYLRPPSTI